MVSSESQRLAVAEVALGFEPIALIVVPYSSAEADGSITGRCAREDDRQDREDGPSRQ